MSTKAKKFWSGGEVAQLKILAASGYSAKEIAPRLGRSASAVRKKASDTHGVDVRVATPKGTRAWLTRKLGNLQRRLGTLAHRVDGGDDAATAAAVKVRLREERSALDALLTFARSHAIPKERYDRLVAKIRAKLEAVRAKIQAKRAIQWKEVLTVINLALVVATRLYELLLAVLGPAVPLLAT